VCAQLHFNIRKETEVQLDKRHWYEHVPKSVETSQGGKVTILWNQQVQTDRTIPNNKIRATGTISKSFRKYVTNIPGKHEVKSSRKQQYWALHTYFGKYL